MGSCDTFVVLPSHTAKGCLIFGKNSDRPKGEVQEVVYFPRKTYSPGEKLQCTYIEVDQVGETHAVILSKPAWMWGAEMGANDRGVAIGNEAVYTKAELQEEERLLGMDLVRLGLERGGSAEEAVDVMAALLEAHGQGGPCSDLVPMNYHNSFLVADAKEAWVLETAGSLWAAQRLTEGFRNISNSLSITTNIDKMSSDLKTYAVDHNLWNGEGELNFKEAFMSGETCPREAAGQELLGRLSEGAAFSTRDMFSVLRDTQSGICRTHDSDFPTAGSQVSVIYKDKPSVHWFTGTPDPSRSVFKPFMFTPRVKISHHTVSPVIEDDPAKSVPRFSREVDRSHSLWRLHAASGGSALAQLRAMEEAAVADTDKFLEADPLPVEEADELFKDVVETEVKFYK